MHTAPQSLEELDLLVSRPERGVISTVQAIDGDILVAGAGGKMGYHLCLMLQRAVEQLGSDNRILAVSRFGDESTRSAFEAKGIATLSANLTDALCVSDLPDAAALFFLAGQKFGTSDSPETLRLFNEEMPALVADRFAGVPTVALSTGCVYPFVTPESGGSRETDPVDPAGDYAVSCRGRELAFLRSSEENGTPLALIRLNYSVDLRYGVLVDLAAKVDAGEPIDVTMGFLNCIWQGDAIAHTIRSLDHVSTAPDACLMNVTGAKILSVREIGESFGKRFGKKVIITGKESATAWLNNAEKSHRLFGPPAIDEAILMEWVARWIENGRPLLGKPTHFEVRDGKY